MPVPQSRLNEGDVVYYDGNRLLVVEGPFRTLDAPGIDQYTVKNCHGGCKSAWRSDLLTHDEYIALTAEGGA